MSDVVVSYDRRDKDRVAFLVEEIRRRGWDVWWDRDLEPANEFAKVVQQKIDTAHCVLVVWTLNSTKSQWVRAEATLAYDRQVLIPVLLDTVDIPIPFNIIDAIDMRSWPDTPSITELERLQRRLARIGANPDKAAVPPQPNDPRLSTRLANKVLDALSTSDILVRAERCKLESSPRTHAQYRTALGFYNELTDDGLHIAAGLFLKVRDVMPAHTDATSRLVRCWHWTRLLGSTEPPTHAKLESDDTRYRAGLEAALSDPDEQILAEYARFVLLPNKLPELAVEYLEKAEQADPYDLEIKFHLARSYASCFNLGECVTKLDECAQISPRAVPVLVYRALVSLQLGQPEAAEQDFEFLRNSAREEFSSLVHACLSGGATPMESLSACDVLLSRRVNPVPLYDLRSADSSASSEADVDSLARRARAMIRQIGR